MWRRSHCKGYESLKAVAEFSFLFILFVAGVSVHVSNASPKAEQMRNSMQNYQAASRNAPVFNAVMGPHQDSMNYGDARSGSGGGGNGSDHARSSFNNPGRGDNAMNQSTIIGIRGYGMNANTYSGGGNNSFGNPLSNNMGGMNGSMPMNNNSSSTGQHMNRSDVSGPYQRGRGGNYVNNHIVGPHGPHGGNNNTNWNNNRNLDMPNLQTLGINSQGPKPTPSAQNLNNSLGVGLNLNSLPMNPAIVAAALNQWSILGNQLQNQPQDQVNNSIRNNCFQPDRKCLLHIFRLEISFPGWLTRIMLELQIVCIQTTLTSKAAITATGHHQALNSRRVLPATILPK